MAGECALAHACDITDEAQVAGLIDEVERRFGRLDILVNNAGQMGRYDFLQAPLPTEPMAGEIAVNLTAPILVTNRALPLLRKSAGGAVVMIGSGYGWVPAAHFPIYSAAKAGLRAFAKSLRMQLEDTGIKVMEVVPPVVDTPATAHLTVPKVSAGEVAHDTLAGLARGAREVFVGRARGIPIALRLAPRLLEQMVGKG